MQGKNIEEWKKYFLKDLSHAARGGHSEILCFCSEYRGALPIRGIVGCLRKFTLWIRRETRGEIVFDLWRQIRQRRNIFSLKMGGSKEEEGVKNRKI